jgi:hypothetical protein
LERYEKRCDSPLSAGQKIYDLSILLVLAVQIQENLPENSKASAKNTSGFASMFFNFEGLMSHVPLPNAMCPTER